MKLKVTETRGKFTVEGHCSRAEALLAIAQFSQGWGDTAFQLFKTERAIGSGVERENAAAAIAHRYYDGAQHYCDLAGRFTIERREVR